MTGYEPLKGFEKLYAINREGSIRSYISNMELKSGLNNRGYYKVGLYKNGVRKWNSLHRLLALQFISNPLELPYIDHINGNRTDNRLINLRWATSRQNSNNKKNNSIHHHIILRPNGNYRVQFRVNGVMTQFGTYKTLDEALSVRDCALDCEGLLNYCYGLEPVNNYFT